MKDLERGDVFINKESGVFHAVLGFLQVNMPPKPKFYEAYGDTEKEAIENLGKVMKEAFDKINA